MDKFEINIDKHQIRKKPPKGDSVADFSVCH